MAFDQQPFDRERTKDKIAEHERIAKRVAKMEARLARTVAAQEEIIEHYRDQEREARREMDAAESNYVREYGEAEWAKLRRV